MRRSAYWRPFLSFAAVTVFIIVGFGSAFIYQASRYSAGEKLESLRANCEVVADLTTHYIQNPTILNSRLYSNTLMYLAELNDYKIIVTNPDGGVLIVADHNGYSIIDAVLPRDIVNEVITSGEKRFTGSLGGFYSSPMFTVGLAVKNPGDSISAAVFLSTESEKLYTLYFDFFRHITLSALIVFVVGTALTSILVSSTTRPLRQMRDAARSYAMGDFSVRVRVKGKNEISDLAETFNSMAQSLEEYDKSREEFLANIAHELRTPMTSISGYIEGILDGTIPRSRQDEYLRIAIDESQRLSRLISSILYLSRIQSDKETLVRSNFNICELTGQVMLGFEPEVTKRNITVEAEFTDYNIMVNADEDSITRVIHNLFGNAVKFCNEGGKIEVKIVARAQRVTVSVHNTGEGISKEDLPYIFERFFKGDRSRGMQTRSTGLGLSISKSIISMHGEEIWATSQQGKFTEFAFTLPLARKMIDSPKN
jgi:signal transduction histidine kinase